jgi:hypothetical protein
MAYIGRTPTGSILTSADIADGSINSSKILDGSVSNDDLAGSIATSKLADITANGITGADIWRLTTSFTGNSTPISSNWERSDDASFSKIGTGMTESSGVFTFPTTGIWWIIFHMQHQFNSTGDQQAFATVQVTVNNGTNWDEISYGLASGGQSSQQDRITVVSSSFFDVQDTSNYKARFSAESVASTNTTNGSSTENQTWVEFIRLGDT